MKSGRVFAFLIFFVIVAGYNFALAADENGQGFWSANHFGKDWGVMIGAKIWPNQWDLPVELFAHSNKTYILEFESGTEFTYIPSFLVRHRNFFIGGSYLSETNYDFANQNTQTYIRAEEENITLLVDDTLSMSGSRKEWDINIGYFLFPNLAISIGYKKLDRDLDISVIRDGYSSELEPLVDNLELKAEYPLSAHAPIIGISASASLTNRSNLYGNFAYGLLDGDASYEQKNVESTKNELDIEGNYTFTELGISYSIPMNKQILSAMTFNIGYRFQRLEMLFKSDGGRWGNSGDQHDSTAGLIIGLSGSL